LMATRRLVLLFFFFFFFWRISLCICTQRHHFTEHMHDKHPSVCIISAELYKSL